MTDGEKARKESLDKQQRITKQWQLFAAQYPEAYNDLMSYIDSQRELYRKYAEERAMPHPNPLEGVVPIDNETISALLQNSRGMSIIQTYIRNRVDTPGVAQPKTK